MLSASEVGMDYFSRFRKVGFRIPSIQVQTVLLYGLLCFFLLWVLRYHYKKQAQRQRQSVEPSIQN
jgi:hypothetical protein